MYASTTPYIFPTDTQKFNSKRPLPLYFSGEDYAYMLVVKAIVNPKEKPYRNLIIVIVTRLLAMKKAEVTISCIVDPIMINFLLPYLSESFPLMMDPKKIPR